MGIRHRLLAGTNLLGERLTSRKTGRGGILYFGWLGHRNLGDEALFEAIHGFFNPDYTFTTLSALECVPLHGLWARLYDVYMIGGGTLINRNEAVLDASLSYSKTLGKSFIFGAGVANGEFWKHLEHRADRSGDWQRYLRSCRFVGVRGPDSLDFMHRLDVPAELIGDPVLALGNTELVKKTPAKRIGLNFGDTGNKIWGGSDFRLWEVLARFIERLLAKGWSVSIFNVFQKDLTSIRSILRAKGWEDRIPIHDHSDCDTARALRYFDDIDVFVGEKLHASVFAAITHTPFVMLEYRPKCHDFMGSMDMLDYNVRVDQANEDQLMELVEKLYDTSADVEKKLFDTVAGYRRRLSDAAAKARAALSD